MTTKEEFIKLLETDKEFRYAVAGMLGLEEILKRHDKHEKELTRLRKDMNKLREDMLLGFKRHDEEIAKLREDMLLGFKRHDEEIAKLREDMNRGFMLVERHISALGARWGLLSEEAFREGIKALIEREFEFKVEKWVAFDSKGNVYGYPCQIEIDTAIHNEKVILIEVKAHVNASDIYAFKRKTELYEETTGKKPSRLLVVTPYAEENAFQAAKHLNIEIYTKV